MSHSDGHLGNDITQELTQNEPEEPEPRRLRLAADEGNGRRSIRA